MSQFGENFGVSQNAGTLVELSLVLLVSCHDVSTCYLQDTAPSIKELLLIRCETMITKNNPSTPKTGMVSPWLLREPSLSCIGRNL